MERQMSLVDQKCSAGNGKGKGSYDGPEVVLKTMGEGEDFSTTSWFRSQ